MIQIFTARFIATQINRNSQGPYLALMCEFQQGTGMVRSSRFYNLHGTDEEMQEMKRELALLGFHWEIVSLRDAGIHNGSKVMPFGTDVEIQVSEGSGKHAGKLFINSIRPLNASPFFRIPSMDEDLEEIKKITI